MMPLQSIIHAGSKVWLDSVIPGEVERNRSWGITGATSNPKIIAGLIDSGEFDESLDELLRQDLDDEAVAWRMTDLIVEKAQDVFLPVWKDSKGDDGYVSFELDPLLEDTERNIPLRERSERYVELGKKWSAEHDNRMIKVPNTDAGVAALEPLAAAGVNVTLTFTPRQYLRAREAIWRGAQRLPSFDDFKSVYSIFVSRIDVYTHKHVPKLSKEAQGRFGIVNAKRIWQMNRDFWQDKKLPLQQGIVVASTGPKLEGDEPWKYVEAFAGGDILTNPPKVNAGVHDSGRSFERKIEQVPPENILREMDNKIDMNKLEDTLMREGIKKFADPQKQLLDLIAKRRKLLEAAGVER